MRFFRKRIILGLLAVLLCMSGVSCSGGEKTQETGTGGVTDTAAIEEGLSLVIDGSSEYRIVYPEGASAMIVGLASELQAKIKEYTGARLAVNDDFLARGETAQPLEILIGNTNRSESGQVLAELRGNEYAVALAGKKLVMCGTNDSSTASAVRYFIQNSIQKSATLSSGMKNGTLLITEKNGYRKENSYFIRHLTVNGVNIGQYRFVVPADGIVEEYFAKLLVQHLKTYSGYILKVVTDTESPSPYEIRIGKTNRTQVVAPAGQYVVAVTATGLEIVSDCALGMTAAYDAVTETVFTSSKSENALVTGNQWTGENNGSVSANAGDVRILFHNVWGYINADGSNPISDRADLGLAVYQAYTPDILCLEEAGGVYRSAAKKLYQWLYTDYQEICYTEEGGTGNPIYYNKSTVELLDSGYNKSRNGDKGSTWGVFRLKKDGTVFAVCNSHFAADTNAGDDPVLGDEYRKQDAQVLVAAVEAILNKYPEIAVFTGGDYNSLSNSAAYTVLRSAGLTNVRNLTSNGSTYSPFHGSFPYNAELDLYPLQYLLKSPSDGAIDHIMHIGTDVGILQYKIVSDPIALTTSDHAPHLIDVSFKN